MNIEDKIKSTVSENDMSDEIKNEIDYHKYKLSIEKIMPILFGMKTDLKFTKIYYQK